MMLAGGKVIRHGILEHGALGQLLGVEYLLRATFNRANIALAAGDLETQAPGSVQDGALTVVETDGTAEILSNQFRLTAQTTPLWGDLSLSDAVSRAIVLGRGLLFSYTATTPSGTGQIYGWSDNASFSVNSFKNSSVWHWASNGTLRILIDGNTNDPILVSIVAGRTYKIAVILGGWNSSGLPYYAGQTKSNYTEGVSIFVKEPVAFPNYTLVWTNQTANTSPLYAGFMGYQGTANLDNIRVPDVDLSSVLAPVTFSSFTGSNGTSLDAITPEVGPAWVEQSGDWDTQGNRAACNGAGIATTNDGIANGLFGGVVNTGTDDNPARVVRFTDTSNYWYLQADQANNLHELHEVNATVDTVRASTAKTFNASTDYTLMAIPDGTTITGFADNASRITYASATLNQTATRHGIRAETANGRFDNPVSYARTSAAYNILDTV